MNYRYCYLNRFIPKISLVILFTLCHTIVMMLVGRIWIGSNDNPLVDVFLCSHQEGIILSWLLMSKG